MSKYSEFLAKNGREAEQLALLGKKTTNEDTLKLLGRHGSDTVKAMVAIHKNTTPEILHDIAEGADVHTQRAIAYNEKAHDITLHHIAKNNKIPYTHLGIIKHPNVHPDTLDYLAKNSDDPDVIEAIKKSKKTDPNTLRYLDSEK